MQSVSECAFQDDACMLCTQGENVLCPNPEVGIYPKKGSRTLSYTKTCSRKMSDSCFWTTLLEKLSYPQPNLSPRGALNFVTQLYLLLATFLASFTNIK